MLASIPHNHVAQPRAARLHSVARGLILLLFLALAPLAHASQTNGTIDPAFKYAWGTVAGYINFAPTNGGLTITDSLVTGYAWGANTGWIHFNATNGGVTNTTTGTLGGYAWDSGGGWVSFAGVTIDSSGKFHGTATGGTINGASYAINFNCTNCDVRTDWRPVSARNVTPPAPVSAPAPSGGGGGGGGSTSLGNPTSSSDKLLSVTVTPSIFSLPAKGGPITYTYRIANSGASYGAISNVVVADAVCSPVKYVSGDTNNDARIDLNEKWTFICSTNLSRTTRNIVNVTGHASASLNAFTIAQDTTVIVGTRLPQASASSVATASTPSSAPLSIKQLQQFLNTHGFVIARAGAGSPGSETDYFGHATQTALAKFQAANGITPAIGYFGSATRAFVENIRGTTKVVTVPPQQTIPASLAPISVSIPSIFTRDLDRYMTGADVKALQSFLIKQNTGQRARDLIAIEEDGYFGTLTRNALAEFQAANGITPSTGYFGTKTRNFIKKNL